MTAKYLIDVAPIGAVTFIGNGFFGSTTDKVVNQQHPALTHPKAGDLKLADKGLLTLHLLPTSIMLSLPAFLSGRTQLTKEEAIFSRKVAFYRIHTKSAFQTKNLQKA